MTVYIVTVTYGDHDIEPVRVYANLADAQAYCRTHENCDIREFEVLGDFPEEDQ